MVKYKFAIEHTNGSTRNTTIYANSEDEAYDKIYEKFSDISSLTLLEFK